MNIPLISDTKKAQQVSDLLRNFFVIRPGFEPGTL